MEAGRLKILNTPFLVTLKYNPIFQGPKDGYLLLTKQILTPLEQNHKYVAKNLNLFPKTLGLGPCGQPHS